LNQNPSDEIPFAADGGEEEMEGGKSTHNNGSKSKGKKKSFKSAVSHRKQKKSGKLLKIFSPL